VKFWDRLYAASLMGLPDNILPGRFSTAEVGALINGSQYPQHTQLHYGLSGILNVEGDGTSGRVECGILEELLPQQLVRSAISEVVPEPIQLHSLNDELIKNFIPLVPRVNERIQKTTFERTLSKRIGFLEEVCRDPITLLRVEVERVHTDRARRIPPDAIEYLASHAEDWSRRTLTGVEPERVLSEIINDDYNIYENRVAATLIDRLYVHLLKRIHEIEELKGTLKEKSQIEKNSLNSWHRNRVYSLWGESASEDAAFIAENTLQFLQGLTRRIGNLMDSMLYKSIPGRQRNENNIVDTNIIANELNYREVALLLNELNTIVGRHIQKSEAEIYRTRLGEINSFEGFCYLLVLRTLVEFGYAIKKHPGNKVPENSLALSSIGLPDITISRGDGGNLTIKTGHSKDIIIVPIFAKLSALMDTRKGLADQTCPVQPISEEAQQKEHVILLYPDNFEIPLDRLSAIPYLESSVSGLFGDDSGIITPLHVSPFSFYNIERIGLCLRRWIYGANYCDYPREVPVNNSLKQKVTELVDCLTDQHINGFLHLQKPILASEISLLTKYLKAEVKKAEGKGKDYITRKLDLEKMLVDMLQMKSSYEDLLVCPVCHIPILERGFTSTGTNTYRCQCSNCDTVWGLDACAHCKQPFPFIRPVSDTEIGFYELYKAPEKSIGLDGIALPCCTDEAGALHITCSKCGNCSKHGLNHLQEAS
jgi:hypothetical protein